jgi:hypothetical protein
VILPRYIFQIENYKYDQRILLSKNKSEMVPKRLERNISLLDVLHKARKEQRDALINTATRDQIQCICDCASNILDENFKLGDSDLRRLKRYKNFVRYLSKKQGNIEKKKLVIQHGGFLGALLTPVLSLAGSLLIDAIKK